MRRWTMAALVAAALGGTAVQAPSAAVAASAPPGIPRDAALLHTAQYYGERHYSGDRGPRHRWREHRRAHEEARTAKAAGREAYRIEQERMQRRAWRRAMREQRQRGKQQTMNSRKRGPGASTHVVHGTTSRRRQQHRAWRAGERKHG